MYIYIYMFGLCFSDQVVESKLTPNRSMITNYQVDEYNRAAIDIL